MSGWLLVFASFLHVHAALGQAPEAPTEVPEASASPHESSGVVASPAGAPSTEPAEAPASGESATAPPGVPADPRIDVPADAEAPPIDVPPPPAADTDGLPPAPASAAGPVELHVRMDGDHPDAVLHLRRDPREPWEPACTLPCALTITPGDWHFGLELSPDDDEPIGGDPDPVYLGRSGSVSLRFYPRLGRHVGGAAMILGGIALLATAVGLLVWADDLDGLPALIPTMVLGVGAIAGGIAVVDARRLVRMSWSP